MHTSVPGSRVTSARNMEKMINGGIGTKHCKKHLPCVGLFGAWLSGSNSLTAFSLSFAPLTSSLTQLKFWGHLKSKTSFIMERSECNSPNQAIIFSITNSGTTFPSLQIGCNVKCLVQPGKYYKKQAEYKWALRLNFQFIRNTRNKEIGYMTP